MSYILEALKKSEQERERGSVPDIKTVHTTQVPVERSRKSSFWWYLLLVVVLVNGAIFAVVFLGQETTENPESAVESMAAPEVEQDTQQVQAPPDNQSGTPSAAEPVTVTRAPEKNQEQTSPPQQEVVQQPPRVVFSTEPLQADDTIGNDVPALKEEKQAATTSRSAASGKTVASRQDTVMLVSELPEDVRKQIPNIAFEGHVYSSSVERRSVMLNGKKVREGDTVSAGLVVKAITPFGAEFEYRGYRFKLDALQDWSYR